MTATKLSKVLAWVVMAASCGGVGPLTTDGGAGRDGRFGSTGSAGRGGRFGSTGGAGEGGTDGGVAGTLGGAPGGEGSSSCGYALPQAECEAMPGCAFFQAPSCNGKPGVTFCYGKGAAVDYFCPSPPPSCSTLDQAACQARTDCRVDHCPDCSGSDVTACAALTDAASACPHCPVACSKVTNLSDCSVRADCHAVFVDPGTCDCAEPGCCAQFSLCADGDQAICTGKPVCKSAAPHCEGIFAVSYTGTCYEGCVEKTDCAALP